MHLKRNYSKRCTLSHDLEPLILSFAQSGYFTQEPLIGVQQNDDPGRGRNQQNDDPEEGKELQTNDPGDEGVQQNSDLDSRVFVVVEGNRRLAALKILLFDWAQKAVGISSLPDIEDSIRQRLDPVPVKEYGSREEVMPLSRRSSISGDLRTGKPWPRQGMSRS